MKKNIFLATLIGLSAITYHMPSFAMEQMVEQKKADWKNNPAALKPLPVSSPYSNIPSDFKTGVFYGSLWPLLFIPSFREACLTKAFHDDSNFRFAKGFGTGLLGNLATITAATVGGYTLYKKYFSKS